jgi:hypothetical protein
VAEQDGFHTEPIDGAAELLHEFDGAILFQAVGKGDVGEIQAAGGLFECHGDLLS